MISPEFLLTALIVVLIPGTGVIYTVSTGLLLGWRASVPAALGCTAGIVPHLLASSLGLAAILHLSAVAFQTIKFAGALYLFYLAWGMWRETGAIGLGHAAQETRGVRIALRGFLINILNPKLSIFFLAFMPQFVHRDMAPLPQLLTLGGIFMLMTFAVFLIYGALAHLTRARVLGSSQLRTGVQRTFAIAFAALGVKLALTER